MADTRGVFRNPALRLMVTYTSDGVTGRSRELDEKMVKRLPHHQEKLGKAVEGLIKDFATFRTFDGRVQMCVSMRDDAIAPGKTPKDLFLKTSDLLLTAPWRDGFIVETTLKGLKDLLQRLKDPTSVGKKYDIANIDDIIYFPDCLIKDKDVEAVWGSALTDEKGRKAFRFQTSSFSTTQATKDVLSYFSKKLNQQSVQFVHRFEQSDTPVGEKTDAAEDPALSSVPKKVSNILPSIANITPKARQQYSVISHIETLAALRAIILSGSAVRWEPIGKLSPLVPGEGEEPPLDRSFDTNSPVVGVIDGGYHGNRYKEVVAWEAPKLVDDADADRKHGNVVASMIVDAHLWSNQLDLEDWTCQLGVVQAVPKREYRLHLPFEKIAEAIEDAMLAHPDTKVWNLSANFGTSACRHEVSEAAHLLGQVARKHGRLLVISAGNRSGTDPEVISPPADCEAALVIAGRQVDMLKKPTTACPKSRTAFGPDFMTKPDLSWYSEHRVLGGNNETGTSYAAPLVSRLAAHCFENVSEPTPDLVRALMINSADLPRYCKYRGFGTPSTTSHPWLSTDAAVVLAWTETVKAQSRNRWAGIVIPPSMIHDGRIVGRIKLVAVLMPRVQRRGDQYIATRLQTSIHSFHNGDWVKDSILKPLQSVVREATARAEHAKWQPIQCFEAEWSIKKPGPKIDLDKPIIRVGGRVYWRHKYMFEGEAIKEQKHKVAFAMTLEAPSEKADTYNEFRQLMGDNVQELAVGLEQEVEEDQE